MDDKTSKTQIKRWWIACIAAIIVVELIVAAALFIPQNRLLDSLARQDAETEKSDMGRLKSADMLRETNASIDLAAAELAELNLPGKQAPPHAILSAVARANAEDQVKLVSFTRIKSSGETLPPEQSPSWSIEVRGQFPDVIRFLNRIEKEGILLESEGFKLTTSDKGQGVLVHVGVSSHTESSLQGRFQDVKMGGAKKKARKK